MQGQQHTFDRSMSCSIFEELSGVLSSPAGSVSQALSPLRDE